MEVPAFYTLTHSLTHSDTHSHTHTTIQTEQPTHTLTLTHTNYHTDRTTFTNELSVETSLYDDGTIREAEITFTVRTSTTIVISISDSCI